MRPSGRFFFRRVVKCLLQRAHRFGVVLDTAEDAAPDLGLAPELVEGRQLQHTGVFYILNAVVSKLLQQRIQDGARLFTVAAERIALLHLIGTLAAGERFLVEGHMRYEIESIQLASVGDRLLQNIQWHAQLRQLVDYRLLALGGRPSTQEFR